MPSSDASEIYTLSLHDALPIFEGEPYERGYQHGRLLAPEIAGFVRCFAAQQSSKAPAEGWRLTRTLVDSLFVRRYEKEYLEEMKRSEEHTSELQSLRHLVCRLLTPPRSTLFPYTTLFRSSKASPTSAATSMAGCWRRRSPASCAASRPSKVRRPRPKAGG